MEQNAKNYGVHFNVFVKILGPIVEYIVKIVEYLSIKINNYLDFMFRLYIILIYLDINTQGLTFITRESYFKRNYFTNNITELSQESYYKLLTKNMLMNLRTYDENSLILHANDHLNNFVQLFIINGNSVVFVFNHFHKIYNITVKYPGIFLYINYYYVNL